LSEPLKRIALCVEFVVAKKLNLNSFRKQEKGKLVSQIAVMGAGGKMGCRLIDNLINHPEKYNLHYVEISPAGIENLARRGLHPTPQAEALDLADTVILALPDKLIGKISHEIVPKLRTGTMLISLDPAASYAGVIPLRQDLSYFVSHPCHPPLFGDETTAVARSDWFGGENAKQNIVSALHHGSEDDYAKGDAIACDMYAPVIANYRVTVEQMAILEPALVETICATMITALREAYDEAVKLGVPKEAAWAFLSGHLRVEVAIIFGLAGFPFSDAAQMAVKSAYSKIFQPDWKEKIMNMDALKRSVAELTNGA
jgi:D-apionate oxidoisomerase